MLAVNKSLISQRIIELECSLNECPWVEIITQNHKVYIGVVYFPPNSSKESYKSFFDKIDQFQFQQKSDIIILGDFNLHQLSNYMNDKRSVNLDPLETYVLNRVTFLNLEQFNQVKNHSQRTLDLIFTSIETTKVSKSEVEIVEPDKHHPCLEVSFRYYPPTKVNISDEPSYNFGKADGVRLYHLLNTTDWKTLYEKKDTNEALDLFYKEVYSILDVTVPKTKIKKRNNTPIWLTADIKKKFKKK